MSQPTATRAGRAAPPRGLLRATGTRAPGVWLLLLAVLAVAVLSIAVGTRPIGLATVWQALTDSATAGDDAIVVRELRVPRTVLGLLPDALPVGILTAVVGAPYLLWLLVRGRRRSPL